MTATARYLARLEPVLFGDAAAGGVLAAFAAALMAPRELFDVARESDTHAPWGTVLDPDACPPELLDWLALVAGVEFPPSALTVAEKRYRLIQAAGRYRATPRAVIEELQLYLTGTKTVYVGFHTPDEWHYSVATIASETPDPEAVERAVLAQKPAGMLVETFTTDEWSYFVIGPTLVGYRDGDGYAIGAPTYPDYASIVAAFSDYQHLEDNDPHL